MSDWQHDYFNYFTECEEQFQRARGTGLFLLSPLDWALLESWKNSGIPLAAVLRGIDAAFEKWRSRKSKTQLVNSIAYCAQAVAVEAKLMTGAGSKRPKSEAAAPFTIEEVGGYLGRNAQALKQRELAIYVEIAASLERLQSELAIHFENLEELELRLTALEDRLVAAARAAASESETLDHRRELDRQLRGYRGKMTTEQLAMLEKQYLDRLMLEANHLPRLSLFYLH